MRGILCEGIGLGFKPVTWFRPARLDSLEQIGGREDFVNEIRLTFGRTRRGCIGGSTDQGSGETDFVIDAAALGIMDSTGTGTYKENYFRNINF